MRLITYKNREDGAMHVGVLINNDSEVVSLSNNGFPKDMNEIVKLGSDGLTKINKLLDSKPKTLSISEIDLLAPIPRPLRNIMCVGKNYHDHAKEFYGSGFDSSGKKAVADFPVIFTKATTSVIATGDEIILANDYTNTTDYEGELGIVLSKGGKNITSNCVPCCLSCNGKKSDSEVLTWYRSQNFYDPRRSMAIRAWFSDDLNLAEVLLNYIN